MRSASRKYAQPTKARPRTLFRVVNSRPRRKITARTTAKLSLVGRVFFFERIVGRVLSGCRFLGPRRASIGPSWFLLDPTSISSFSPSLLHVLPAPSTTRLCPLARLAADSRCHGRPTAASTRGTPSVRQLPHPKEFRPPICSVQDCKA